MKKYEGAGNSFVVLFDTDRQSSREDFVSRFGQEIDGVIFVTQSTKPPHYYQMNFYNRDGSKADFCGNGSRCFLRFLYDNQKVSLGEEILFETGYGFLQGTMVQEDYATVEIPSPTKEQMMEVGGYSGYFLTVGVPHFVVFLISKEILENLDLATEGSKIRNHPSFSEGTNVDFVTILSDDSLRIRTYERGVEGETKACGSGSTASSVVFVSQFQPSLQTVHVITNGGLLTVNFKLNKIYCSGGVQDV